MTGYIAFVRVTLLRILLVSVQEKHNSLQTFDPLQKSLIYPARAFVSDTLPYHSNNKLQKKSVVRILHTRWLVMD